MSTHLLKESSSCLVTGKVRPLVGSRGSLLSYVLGAMPQIAGVPIHWTRKRDCSRLCMVEGCVKPQGDKEER